MAKKTIRINGIDFTSCVPRAGYMVTYKKMDGGQGGMMLDGSTTVDTLAIKAVVTVPVLPSLGDAAISTILSELLVSDYPTLSYFDPWRNEYREVETIVDGVETLHAGTNINYDEVWKTPSLVFTER